MSRPTFEQALRTTLGNSRTACIVEDELPLYYLREAIQDDRKAVEDIIDKLAEDLSALTGRPIKRFSRLNFNPHMYVPPGYDIHHEAKTTFHLLNKAIAQYLKFVFDAIRSSPQAGQGVLTYPISKVFWEKTVAHIQWPDERDRVKTIKLRDPEQKSVDSVECPPHIRRFLDICSLTNFDYQPYVLDDGTCKILCLKLGCDWHDLAIATWTPPPVVTMNVWLTTIITTCFAIMGGGLWGASHIEAWYLSYPLMLLSGVVGVIGGLLTTLLFASLHKPLKL